MGESRRAVGVIAALLITLACASCTAGDEGVASPTPSEDAGASASTSATPVETVPTLQPQGSADANLPFFASVIESVWAGDDRASGRAYVDALVAAGFDKASMQVTPDQTSIGNAVDALSVSVKWADQCLIGQAGPEIGEAVAVVLPALADGPCLAGATRPIDW